MYFAAIVPTDFARAHCMNRPLHMCLAQWYLKSPEYARLFNELSAKSTVILDNGAYEGERVSFEELYQVVCRLQPKVTVLPDVPGEADASWELGSKFKERYPNHPYMRVLHGSFAQCVEQYKVCREPWIAFSKLLSFRRAELVKHLQEERLWKRGVGHHALGFQYNDMQELASRHILSIDSSSPVWRATFPLKTFPRKDFNPTLHVDHKKGLKALQHTDDLCCSE